MRGGTNVYRCVLLFEILKFRFKLVGFDFINKYYGKMD